MIRPADRADTDALAELEREAFESGAWSRAQVVDELSADSRRVVVAERGDRVIGYAAIFVAGGDADLTRVVVADAHRRSGVASRLLAAVEGAAREAGAERLLVEVAESNAAARALYAAHGYDELARRPGYYADGDDALVLARAVP